MDLYEKTIKLCKEFDIKPARSRGQNFLIQESVFDNIVDAACINSNDTVLEVGPGLGFMTEKLAQKSKKVTAVELDDRLASVLEKRMKNMGINNVQIVNGDVLDFRFKTVDSGDYKVVANLPYNITSVFLRKFLSGEKKPKSMTLMLQKEVCERIVAKKGKMSVLAVSIFFYANVEQLFEVPASYFYPAPKVDSAVIKIDLKDRFPEVDEKRFFRLVKHGFSSKRKMLKKNLSAGFQIGAEEVLERMIKANIEEKARAENLQLEDWLSLYTYFY